MNFRFMGSKIFMFRRLFGFETSEEVNRILSKADDEAIKGDWDSVVKITDRS